MKRFPGCSTLSTAATSLIRYRRRSLILRNRALPGHARRSHVLPARLVLLARPVLLVPLARPAPPGPAAEKGCLTVSVRLMTAVITAVLRIRAAAIITAVNAVPTRAAAETLPAADIKRPTAA